MEKKYTIKEFCNIVEKCARKHGYCLDADFLPNGQSIDVSTCGLTISNGDYYDSPKSDYYNDKAILKSIRTLLSIGYDIVCDKPIDNGDNWRDGLLLNINLSSNTHILKDL